jgi:threonine 3-dehydrogenase
MSTASVSGHNLSPVITHRYHNTEFEKGLEMMMSGQSGKIVLEWTG